jgi:hypothetical protein
MRFVAIYQIGEDLSVMEYTADDWTQAYDRAREFMPQRASLRSITDSKESQIKKLSSGKVQTKIPAIVIKVEA